MRLRFNPSRHLAGGARFEPLTERKRYGIARNPIKSRYGKALAARIFVGFNVGGKRRWRMSDVVRIVKRVRSMQVGSPNSTFLAQMGIYKPPGGKAVTEHGAQVILIDEQGMDVAEWSEQIVQLAEVLAGELRQMEVLVEIQHGGVVVDSFGVEA